MENVSAHLARLTLFLVADDRAMSVAFVFDSDPLQSKICHCEDCQRLHGEFRSRISMRYTVPQVAG